jgi:hypothetical protein
VYGAAFGAPAVSVRTDAGTIELVLSQSVPTRTVCEILRGPRASYLFLGGERSAQIDSEFTLYFAALTDALAITANDQLARTLGPAYRPPSCRSLDDADWARLRARDLRLPTVAVGGTCPVSPVSSPSPHYAAALGAGPIYPVLGSSERRFSSWGLATADGYRYDKVLWIAAPDYQGPALIRGQRIDGAGEVLFDAGERELRFERYTGVSSAGTAAGGRDRPSGVGFPGPGCYAMQIDGLSFTTWVVMEIRP